jgi:hypothetical protein
MGESCEHLPDAGEGSRQPVRAHKGRYQGTAFTFVLSPLLVAFNSLKELRRLRADVAL